MIIQDRTYKDKIVDILSKSFDDNQSINFIVKQDRKRRERIRYLMDYCFEVCMIKGQIFLSEDHSCCALILFPKRKLKLLQIIWLDINLAIRSIGFSRIGRVMKREKLIKENHPKSDFCYLWFIGVDPLSQGRGKGTALLSDILQHCDEKSQNVYLETSVLKNLPWYEKHGFEIINEIDIGYKLFQMIRN